ncbi:rRNA maturation RNase YbeY [Phaeobacter sp. B1627]|uniref:rRNA maturation RNase YbeY n=1 Tax=Phaeobacter sp. B1627 TaxID=2583809 RepID=UPI001118698E|nr:rRNA maturation RNase YbeY [Phaeobacter sp. B1627]TNJ39981.1 rRNA maturation RNase YbeY [Phaeobacter sp. B1627]
MILDVVIEDSRWGGLALKQQATVAVEATLSLLGYGDEDWEVTVLGCDDARIAELNAEFREKAKATNVLSWPAQALGAEEDGGAPTAPEMDFMGDAALGDIAISYDTCMAEASDAGRDPLHHVCHLLVHGTLHLLGYDHIRDGDATVMETLEVEILGKLGIPDPYILQDGS